MNNNMDFIENFYCRWLLVATLPFQGGYLNAAMAGK
jgi:hypothetical protein